MMLAYSSVDLTNVIYAATLTDGSHWCNVRFTKFIVLLALLITS